MLISDLMRQLNSIKEAAGNVEVFVSKDAEGNDFNSLYSITIENKEELLDYVDEEEVMHKVVVMWP